MYDDKQPELVTKTFNVSQYIYASFKLSPDQSGYIAAKWYINGGSGEWSNSISAQGRVGYGYFSASYSGPGQGAVEYYWCPSSDCSDGELAWVRTFEVR
ncbi:hypothetical protein KSX_10500 [Ktedonospora formicarum]|uniref:Uncharacterized protein n=2 Tax=Ktedonospora formicarum TaxID=2778364 RepID=A0A8J3HS21_9CHLR|nr:hypothetical protein KSX_10500 [Ktedonospora formicarum]